MFFERRPLKQLSRELICVIFEVAEFKVGKLG